MKNIIVTVGITAYNAQETITAALESVLSQNWPQDRLEIIIVDDASADATPEILRGFAANHNCKLILLSNNQGVAHARNQIIEQASGDYIAFFDDDDVSSPDRLQKQHEVLAGFKNTGVGALCHTARLQCLPGGKQRVEKAFQEDRGKESVRIAERLLLGHHLQDMPGSVATCSQMGPVEIYRRLKFDEAFRRSEDTDFCVRAALDRISFIGIQECLVTQTITVGQDKTLFEEERYFLKLLEKHKNFIEQYEPFSFIHGWMRMRYAYIAGQYGRFFIQVFTVLLKHPVCFFKRFMRIMRAALSN